VTGDQSGTVLEAQDLPQPRDVIGERGERELRGDDVVAVGLQSPDDIAQQEPSAHAPWTSTMFGWALIGRSSAVRRRTSTDCTRASHRRIV